jgi:V/A-type H+-transporting ATPase subunit I
MVSSSHVFAATGYVRTSRLETFRARLAKEFPGAEIDVLEPVPGEEPPVSMRWNNFVRPAGLLVNMFGLPNYRSIDPTNFLTLSFLVFFGICYGDVLYGVMLIGLAAWLRKRFKDQRGLVQFFRLFTYAGVSTVIFGYMVGSWGADLPKYFGETNPIEQFRVKSTLLDPLAKPIIALAIAVGIGITNQFYGIFMRFLRDFRRGDITSSIFDGVFWLTYLGSLLVLAFSLATGAPKAIAWGAAIIFIVSAVGLVLTQGRAEKSWPARIVTGIISLYGIMGTYGTTSFVGDVISYSRLMALGMTTSVVGMSFNIIAGMVKGIPYIGWVLFFAVAIFGHLFNFAMSIMSAFVHSARLILLEWFGRFYEGGGTPFRPFGFQSRQVDLVDHDAA